MLKKRDIKSNIRKVPKVNVAEKFGNNKIKRTDKLSSFDFDKLDLDRLSFDWFDELAKESFHCEEHQFINFLLDDIPDENCQQILSDARLFVRSLFSNINCLRDSKRKQEQSYKRNSRIRELFLYSMPTIKEYLDTDNVYKLRPRFMNKEIGVRVFCSVMVDDSNSETIQYYMGVFLVDCYHLVIPSAFVYKDSSEYKRIVYDVFKSANQNIFDFKNFN